MSNPTIFNDRDVVFNDRTWITPVVGPALKLSGQYGRATIAVARIGFLWDYEACIAANSPPQ